MRRTWRVRLAERAELDFFSVLRWTTEQFGKRQARVYETTLRDALKALASGPDVTGYRAQPDLGSGIASLHVARRGRKGRHLLVFRPNEQDGVIEVLRIVHDSMDLQQQLRNFS